MIAALVNYYDEGPLLVSMVGELAKLNVDAIVAVEGPYALYPPVPRLHDRDEETAGLINECDRYGIQYHWRNCEPHIAWSGNEVQKRQTALDMGIEIGADWFLIWDADFVIDHEQSGDNVDLQSYAQWWPKDAGDCMIYEGHGGNPPWRNRPFLRYVRGMKYTTNHHSIIYPDGTLISTGMVSTRYTVPNSYADFGDLLPIMIRHERAKRPEQRLERQQAYYDKRDRLRIEG